MHNTTEKREKDKILRNCFTAYLASAVQHRRVDFLKQLDKENRAQEALERKYLPQHFDLEKEAFKNLPVVMKMENEALVEAFLSLEDREQYILLKRIVDEASLKELAILLGLSDKGAGAAYYRAANKLRRKMEGK